MKTKIQTKNWEERLARESNLGLDWFISKEHYEKAKSLIRQLLAETKQEFKEIIEEKISEVHRVQIGSSDYQTGKIMVLTDIFKKIEKL